MVNSFLLKVGFFEQAAEFFKSIISFCDNIFKNLRLAFSFISSFNSFTSLLISFLPAFISSVVILVCGICIINYVIGR